MGKDKPKTRLDKGGGNRVEFIGFGAFDNQTVAASPSSTNAAATAPVSCWTPVYAGSESDIRLLFPRISQKKDAITKVKAIRELVAYFQNPDNHKKLQAETLAHWAWLYHHRLVYDSHPSVRAESLSVWKAAADRIPRACKSLVEFYPELCGMLYCAQCDGDAQVALQYRQCIAPIIEELKDWPWQQGLYDYTDRILFYGRPSVMHLALFAKKDESSKTQLMNEQQRDELEERFERIVGTALAALEVWVRQHAAETTLTSAQDLWFQTLTSSKPVLRYKTYHLLATCIIKQQEHLLPEDIVTTLLQKVMPVEKEPNNIPTLLETLLLLFSKQRQHASAFYKPLQKLLSKACYGARVSNWGPTILPLLSCFDQKLSLLHALQEGRPLGAADTWQLQQVIVECSAFALLQRKTEATESSSTGAVDDAQAIVQVWVKAFVGTMLTPKDMLAPAVHQAYDAVLQELAKSLLRFGDASTQRQDCDFYGIKDWFWIEGFRVESGCDALAVAGLISSLRGLAQSANAQSLILPTMRTYFMEMLAKYQGSSGSVPSDGAYRFFQESLRYFGRANIFDTDGIDRFVMNDLLRWMIIHTSSLSTQEQSHALVDYDFCILGLCLDGLPDKARLMWPTLLTEIVSAKCSLGLLVTGLESLVKTLDSVTWIRCDVFDCFATEIALRSSPINDADQQNRTSRGSATAELRFLRLCLGISVVSPHVLFDHDVVSTLIDRGCLRLDSSTLAIHPTSEPLVQVLVELVGKHESSLSEEQIDRILLSSWFFGGEFFDRTTVRVLNRQLQATQRMTANTSSFLLQELHALCQTSAEDSFLCSTNPRIWSEQAWRFIRTCRALSKEHDEVQASLELIGLADLELWRKHAGILFECATAFLERVDSPAHRIDIIQRSCEDPGRFLASVLLELSQASDDAYGAIIVKAGKDRAGIFLSLILGEDADPVLSEALLRALVARAKTVQLPDGRAALRRCVAVISRLLCLMFGPINDTTVEDAIDPVTVKEGMKLWYILDASTPDERAQAEVVKVHYDAQAGYYFSIKVGLQERQTVAERLRRKPVAVETKDDRSVLRDSARASLLDLVRTHLDLRSPEPILGELINVLCGIVGLGAARGIGSSHYDIVSQLMALEQNVCIKLERDKPEESPSSLWTLACALGFTINVPSCALVRNILSSDPVSVLKRVSLYYEQNGFELLDSFNEAVLAWLTVALISFEKDGNAVSTASLLFRLFLRIERHPDQTGFNSMDVNLTSSIHVALKVASKSDLLITDARDLATKAIHKWLHDFAAVWEGGESVPDWFLYSEYSGIVELIQNNKPVQQLCVLSCSSATVEHLSASLSCPWKRHLSFLILQLIATDGISLFEDEALNVETTDRLEAWTSGFETEEAEEVEEDIEIVSRWLPRRMMREVEHWGEEIYEDTDDATNVARFLMWLCVLRFVDTCSPKDFRYRPAFLSYLSQSGAVFAALNLALLNDEAINSPNKDKAPALLDVEVLLHDPALFLVPTVASLVLFQTIELLPSLSRKWFEESCPKVYLSDVQSFVEKYVSPEILRRELSRVRVANPDFGAMSVATNSSIREVKASYIQDDFTLSVVISLPSAFPFRSAEVDCSNTVGVPSDRLRRWSLQIRTMLNNQGGTLQDALMLWKDNVDKEFEGVEPCPVCYSVLHVKTHKLPTLKCKTCQNRFHFDCLNQWFRSSGKNQCVLCQQPWQGTRV